ncbi:ferredoxin-type protein NapF [sulfur-oxidizing endosymbiont of Gigantopelta aegis]|uniref:ferredoxin-type protein NapF n=1 Tax=sulfur-oxidizing endosymbiont of Gigantopelta aegis TaxID=2794934 RepID=UPI001FE8361D|nr:ferredoxin-type protein NapF [sulfur-oxidizing endosymbiont of Gigantopelta aegis]
MTKITRMQLLRGDLKGEKTLFRPPWALPEEYFIDYCTRCNKCVDACFDELIVKGRGGFPQMDFKRGGCDFCEDCLNICPDNALKKVPTNVIEKEFLPPWQIKASIDLSNCLSMNATICRSCGESCDDEAINFTLKLGGIAEPELNVDACTGCGACFSVCPVQVISLRSIVLDKENHQVSEMS